MNKILNPVNKECLVCKKMMLGVRTDRKYCSSICSRKASHYISHKNCLSCGLEMKNIHGHQKYCSIECYRKTQTFQKKSERFPGHKDKVNSQQRGVRKKLVLFLFKKNGLKSKEYTLKNLSK